MLDRPREQFETDRLLIRAHADPSQFRTLSLSLHVVGEADLIRPVPVDESNLAMRASGLRQVFGCEGLPAEFSTVLLHDPIWRVPE